MQEIITKINKLYGISVAHSEKVTKGFLSENYILSDNKGKYFLKKYRFDNPGRIVEIHASKKYFADGGIPVILPLKDMDENTFFEANNSFYALFPFVEGRHVEREQLTENSIISLGQMLGKIHLLGIDSKIVLSESFKIENEEKTYKKIEEIEAKISEVSLPTEFDKVALENVQLKKVLLLKNKMTLESIGLKSDHHIHGDYLDHNVFFDDEGNVKWVFDFEKTNYSPRTYELFRSMFNCLLSESVGETNLRNVRTYLDAYSNVYPLSIDEIGRGLQLLFAKSIHGFWVETEHYIKGNNRMDNFLFDDYKRIKYLSENLDILISALTE